MQYDELLDEVREALEDGRLEPRQLERLVRRGGRRVSAERPTTSSVLTALGCVVAFAGVALAYATSFRDLGHAAQIVTPFLFPAAAFGCAIRLSRRGRPTWQVELAGAVGYTALMAAIAAAAIPLDARSGYAAIAGFAGAALALVIHTQLRILRLTATAVSVGLFVGTWGAAYHGGIVGSDNTQWLFLAQAGVAGALGVALLARTRDGAAAAFRAASLLAFFACIAGISQAGDWNTISGWHVVLTVVVALTLVGAATLELGGMLLIGDVECLAWLIAVGGLVGRSTGWAAAVVLAGIGLVALGYLTSRIRPNRPSLPSG